MPSFCPRQFDSKPHHSSSLRRLIQATLLAGIVFAGFGIMQADSGEKSEGKLANLLPFPNSSGFASTFSTTGSVDLTGPFFQSLGTNGRSCGSCHQPSEGWTVTPEGVQRRFRESNGNDPIFRPVDGATCPTDDVSTREARRKAYSLLLNKALIRIDRPLPATAEFSIVDIDDPYGCSAKNDISVYRRPLPSTNLSFLSTVMWDGRENAAGQTIAQDLIQQASDATTGHAQAVTAPDAAILQQIRDFEVDLFTAQAFDHRAGALFTDGAQGGAKTLSQQNFFLGINDPLGGNPTGAAFSSTIFTLFQDWKLDGDEHRRTAEAEAAVKRGEVLFNTLNIPITGVGGLNDKLGVPVINGFCGTCHDSPNVGDHSVAAPLNIGLTDPSQRTPDLPLFTLKNNTTGETVQTTDPGRAMVTGQWADIGKFKGPILRGLAARAPYFHNGSAASLLDVVNFYNTRFKLNLTNQQKSDLVAFLQTL